MKLIGLNSAFFDVLTFAQDGAAPPAGANGPAANPLMEMAPLMVGGMLLFYFMILRPQQRERKKREETLGQLKKNDKVLTIGGIIGTVADLSNDGQRVTLRVDDGTRIKFTRTSIQGPYSENSETAK